MINNDSWREDIDPRLEEEVKRRWIEKISAFEPAFDDEEGMDRESDDYESSGELDLEWVVNEEDGGNREK